MRLIRKRPCLFRLSTDFSALSYRRGSYNDPINTRKIDLSRIIKKRLKGHMIMLCLT